MELQRFAGGASPAAGRDERAPAFVTPPDAPPYLRRDVARARRCPPPGQGPMAAASLPASELGDPGRERTVHDDGDVAARDGVAEQLLGPTELLIRLCARREADLVTVGRQRRDRRPYGRRQGRWDSSRRVRVRLAPATIDWQAQALRRPASGPRQGSRAPTAALAKTAATSVRHGSFRTRVGTAGCGKCRATSASTSRLLRPWAAASRSRWSSLVRCGARMRTVARTIRPAASRGSPGTARPRGPPRSGCRSRARRGGGPPCSRQERPAPGAQVQPAGIELHQVGDERGGRLPLAPCQTVHFCRELVIRKVGWKVILHNPV